MTTFQIFIIKSLSTESEPSALETSFSQIPTTLKNNVKDITYLTEPKAKSNYGLKAKAIETGLGTNCGRPGCKDCLTTHKMIPATPDFGIFEEIRTNHWDQVSGVIIAKTSTTTISSLERIAGDLMEAQTLSENSMDVFYFAKWLDRPDQFTTLAVKAEPTGEIYKIVRTWNAHGFQSLAFSPLGFKKLSEAYPSTTPVVCRPFAQVINTLLQNGTLYGITTTPSLMQYDATLITTVCDVTAAAMVGSPAVHSYLRTSECRGATIPEKPLNRRISNDLSFFWLAIVTIVVLITAWVILKIGNLGHSSSATLTPLGESFKNSNRRLRRH